MMTMGKMNHYLIMLYLASCLFFISHSQTTSNTSSQHHCLPNQSSALLQLRQEFVQKRLLYSDYWIYDYYNGSYPKMKSWKADTDCCSWDGITCDTENGHVVGLNLSNSWLSGTLKSNSSLFNLRHLQKLNLALNDFSSSAIPSQFGQLVSLTHLNLSCSFLSGPIPSEISWLSNLVSLDLSFNYFQVGYYDYKYLNVSRLDLEALVQNMTYLRELHLDYVNISSSLPQSLENLSSLTSLSLSWCLLDGEFPSNIFVLPKIQKIDLSGNSDLSGFLPEFHSDSALQILILGSTNFFGKIPNSIGNLESLIWLDLSRSNFSGELPNSIGNLRSLNRLALSSTNLLRVIPHFILNLSQLTSLSLPSNNFHGQLPSTWGNLAKLTSLDLSNNLFHGEIASSLGNLSQLTSFSLSSNNFHGQLPSTWGNLAKLTSLDLSYNLFHGEIPSSLGNLSQLTSLYLSSNNFHGQLPSTWGKLAKLTSLDLSNNLFHGEILSSLGNLTQLEYLILENNSFDGSFPISLTNLTKLKTIAISKNQLVGPIPFEISRLPHLSSLDLGYNSLTGPIPSSLFTMTSLSILSLTQNQLTGPLKFQNISSSQLWGLFLSRNKLYEPIPRSVANFTYLQSLDLSYNSLTGPIPSFLFTMTSLYMLCLDGNQLIGPLKFQNISSSQLEYLLLSGNKLYEPIPRSVANFTYLRSLGLSSINVKGMIELNIFFELKNIKYLSLSNNNLLISKGKINSTLPKFEFLDLSSCNLREFPVFLKAQNELQGLDLSNNSIEGKIPKWFLNVGKEALQNLDLSFNNLSRFEQAPMVLPWKYMVYFDLRSNKLQGSLPIPPFSTKYFFASNNNLTGRIPSMICKVNSLQVLDLSNNHLIGQIPQCLGNFSSSLSVLNMRNNSFQGILPETFMNGCSLTTLDLNHNHIQGKIPRSLVQCRMLEVLNLGNNKLNDTFPFWLESLLELQILVLRANGFHGPICDPYTKFGLSKLHVIDLSHNNFSGNLPSEYFKTWNAMIMVPNKDKSQPEYMRSASNYYSLRIVNKGIEMEFVKILTIFKAIDLSNNKFYGEIPDSLGNLKGLIVLNLSSNSFMSHIPSSFGNLIELESLDLSQNLLSGEIPQQLTSLTFLEYLNLSQNHLIGPIPQGGQFSTFPNSSFEGNLELCGSPLLKKCVNNEAPTSTLSHESSFGEGFNWKTVVMGYACGLVIGLVTGHVVVSRRPEWFVRTFRVNLHK